MKKYAVIWSLLMALLWSCSGSNESVSTDAIYFPLRDFLEVRTTELDSTYVVKEVTINGKRERMEKMMGPADWLKELEIFMQADLNRPSLASSYETTRSQDYLIHELKSGEKAKVQKVVVRFEDSIVKEISFHTKSENIFYSSETRGVIFARSITGKIDNYVVDSQQKVVFMKPNRMVIRASINN